MNASDQELLREFVRDHSQEAFTELVSRHMDLVYSAALRQVRSHSLAQDVCQSVFTQLARHAPKLAPDTVLTAWLYQVTRHAAIDVIRTEARRQAREQIALQMSDLNQSPADWPDIEPLLDEAMQSLDEPDRTALLLRYFDNKSLREVGESLGASEDAAQKRVSRAVERLRDFFGKRKISVGTSGLAAAVSAHAVQAAPAGLVATVSGAALAASAMTATTIAAVAASAVTITKTIAMTTLQKSVIIAVAALAVAGGWYQARQISHLRGQVQVLEEQQPQQLALSNQVQALERERDRATNALAALAAERAQVANHPNETLKLRGEVGRLRQENAQMSSTSPLSKVTANPEARQLLRTQQKMGMGLIYKGLAQQLKLSSDQTEKLNDALADGIMNEVDQVTTVLRDKPTPEQTDRIFADQETALQQKIAEVLGPDGATQYQEYTRSLLGRLTSDQFKGMLSGSETERDEKAKQFGQALDAAAQAALVAAGLPSDYQTVPILNFRNIASEQDQERSLKLLDDIYQRAATSSSGFLSPDDLTKFQEFKATAMKNSRAALFLNRAMMAPLSN